MQSAFIEGRHILDLILIANEVVEDYRVKIKTGWVLKLDMEKSFDLVEWDFLKILKSKKFNHKWIEWMIGCVKNLRYFISSMA